MARHSQYVRVPPASAKNRQADPVGDGPGDVPSRRRLSLIAYPSLTDSQSVARASGSSMRRSRRLRNQLSTKRTGSAVARPTRGGGGTARIKFLSGAIRARATRRCRGIRPPADPGTKRAENGEDGAFRRGARGLQKSAGGADEASSHRSRSARVGIAVFRERHNLEIIEKLRRRPSVKDLLQCGPSSAELKKPLRKKCFKVRIPRARILNRSGLGMCGHYHQSWDCDPPPPTPPPRAPLSVFPQC